MILARMETKLRVMVDIWEQEREVGFTEVDPSGRLTLYGLFDFLQKESIAHAEDLGVGRVALSEQGLVWMLCRMSVNIERRPELDEEIVIRTWPSGFDKLFALRDYEVMDNEGRTAVSARSGWLLIDIEKRRPLRPSGTDAPLPPNEGILALPSPPRGLDENPALAPRGERVVRYSDIDYNGHVNNARYVQWIQDCLDGDVLKDARKIVFDINYLNETARGETISLYEAKLEDGPEGKADEALAIEGRKSSGETAFRAEVRIYKT